jgi:hypothetical protein
MSLLKIENKYLTGYYLEQYFGDEFEETGLKFTSNGKKIELHYDSIEDLEEKVSYILMRLTDK